jgi:hypothetical protein
MLERFLEIKDQVRLVEAVDEYLPRGTEIDTITELFEKLKKIESVNKAIQEEDVNIETVRALFDSLLEYFPEMFDYLNPGATIVHSPHFESAVS